MPTFGPRAVAALALGAAILASSLAGGGSQTSPSAARNAAARIAPGAPRAGTPIAPVRSGPASCPLSVSARGYANPLAGATVKRERIDQGVDYAGSGTLVAIGAGRITYLGTSNTGWPGAFIEFQLLGGADAGCYVYYAEGVVPADGLAVGQTVVAGQPIATIIPNYPTGIELGWGSGRGTKAYAKVTGQWSTTDDEDNVATAAGKSFSALIGALGGPQGKVEG
jgi:murein DD-endopeptidase MepM/ murein hydrolase activator NlpD